MSKEDDFGFDDDLFDDDSFEDEDLGGDSFEDNFNDDFNDDSNKAEVNDFSTGVSNEDFDEQIGDKGKIIKVAVITIGIGLLLIVGAFVLMRFIKGGSTVQQEVNQVNQQEQTQQKEQRPQKEQVKQVEQVEHSSNKAVDSLTDTTDINEQLTQSSNKVTLNSSTSSSEAYDEWKEFDGDEKVNFNDEYIKSVFTVTGIKNYVKINNNENNLILKTVVQGNLSGFVGTYEVELPYDKGSQLIIGNNFDVEVLVGKYNEKVVIGEIKY